MQLALKSSPFSLSIPFLFPPSVVVVVAVVGSFKNVSDNPSAPSLRKLPPFIRRRCRCRRATDQSQVSITLIRVLFLRLVSLAPFHVCMKRKTKENSTRSIVFRTLACPSTPSTMSLYRNDKREVCRLSLVSFLFSFVPFSLEIPRYFLVVTSEVLKTKQNKYKLFLRLLYDYKSSI